MLSIFRRLINSKAGVIFLLGFLGLIAFAFAAGDVSNTLSSSGVQFGANVARVGGEKIGESDLADRVQRQFEQVRAQTPGLDLPTFVRSGAVEQTLDQMIGATALTAFGEDNGLAVSRRMVDGAIASIPAFRGATGAFDETLFRQLLAQQRVTEAQLRADLTTELMARQMIVPVTGASRPPINLVLPYASLLLETRQGHEATIPVSAIAQGAAPTDTELTAFYNANLPRYTIPERRVIRYALFGRERFADAQPTDAEIAAAYKQNEAQYAARETRDLTQVIVLTESAAKALAAKVAGGASLSAEAQAQGLAAESKTNQTREELARETAPAVADAAFLAAQGSVATARSGLGWHVIRVDKVDQIPAKTLAEVRDSLAAQIKARKIEEGLSELVGAIEDQIADGATFDEVVQAQKLTAVTTPALTAQGRNPDQPDAAPTPEAAALIGPMFQAETQDDPSVEAIGNEGRYALVKLDRIVPATPRPLAQIREQVAADYRADRTQREAQRIATEVAAKVSKGADFAQALAATGLSVAPPKPVGGKRQDVAETGAQASPALKMMFLMREGSAKIVQTPDKTGWTIVRLDKIVPGDARNQPQLVQATQQQFVNLLGQEYADQFVAAARKSVGVSRDQGAIDALKKRLIGQ